MGTKGTKSDVRNENANDLSVPPGFVSLTSFKLRKADGSEQTSGSMTDIETLRRSFHHHPWILACQNNHDNKTSKADPVDMHPPPRCLPKGVSHRCPECNNCLKVTARWRPKNAMKEFLLDAPVFHPTEEEFQDTIKYISSIRDGLGAHGICRIVPPPSWHPPCLEEANSWKTSQFGIQVQRVDGIQNHASRKAEIYENGNLKGRNKCGINLEHGVGTGSNSEETGCENGPMCNLEIFKNYADNFKRQYFCSNSEVLGSEVDPNWQWEPSVDDIEGEYRRIVKNPTEEIEVLYGENLDSRELGCGLPIMSEFHKMSNYHEYLNSGWNLNNTPRLPGSLLSFESLKTSGALVPRLQKVEEHHLYLLCYMHLGAPRVWYVIPGKYRVKFEALMNKYLPELSKIQPTLRDKLIATLSSTTLNSHSIPVYRCVQYPGEFVLISPGAYYSGFGCGFNCVETVNVAPLDWLPHGQNIIELYSEQLRMTSISHDKLLLGAAREAARMQWEMLLLKKNTLENTKWKDACGKNGILTKALKSRVKLESLRREYICTSAQSRRMDQKFDSSRKRACSLCFYDLHLSATWCPCSADKYSCLNHAKQLCSCAWSEKVFLFRYEIKELNILIDALEGNIDAVYRWAKQDLKFAMTSILEGGLHKHVGVSLSNINDSEEMKARNHTGSLDERRQNQEIMPPRKKQKTMTSTFVPSANRPVLAKRLPCEHRLRSMTSSSSDSSFSKKTSM